MVLIPVDPAKAVGFCAVLIDVGDLGLLELDRLPIELTREMVHDLEPPNPDAAVADHATGRPAGRERVVVVGAVAIPLVELIVGERSAALIAGERAVEIVENLLERARPPSPLG